MFNSKFLNSVLNLSSLCITLSIKLLVFPTLIFLGGGSGLGRATCQVLAREGASVVVADKDAKKVEETLQVITGASPQRHLGLELDVSQSSSVKNALEKTIQAFTKPPTIIVNSAGITRDNFLLKMSEEDFDEVINVNLKVS